MCASIKSEWKERKESATDTGSCKQKEVILTSTEQEDKDHTGTAA